MRKKTMSCSSARAQIDFKKADKTPISEPLKSATPWDVVRYKPPSRADSQIPCSGNFMPGIVVGVRPGLQHPKALFVMPVDYLRAYASVDKDTELILTNKKQMRAMGLVRDEDRIISSHKIDKVPNLAEFFGMRTFDSNGSLRSVPRHLTNVITGLFRTAVSHGLVSAYGQSLDPEDRQVLDGRQRSGVYYWTNSSDPILT